MNNLEQLNQCYGELLEAENFESRIQLRDAILCIENICAQLPELPDYIEFILDYALRLKEEYKIEEELP